MNIHESWIICYICFGYEYLFFFLSFGACKPMPITIVMESNKKELKTNLTVVDVKRVRVKSQQKKRKKTEKIDTDSTTRAMVWMFRKMTSTVKHIKIEILNKEKFVSLIIFSSQSASQPSQSARYKHHLVKVEKRKKSKINDLIEQTQMKTIHFFIQSSKQKKNSSVERKRKLAGWLFFFFRFCFLYYK